MENCDDAAIPNTKRRAATNASINIAKRQASNLKRVSSLLRKKRAYKPLSEEQEKFLQANSELVKQFYKRREKRTELLNRQNECEDSPNVLEEKCQKLAQAIHDAEFLIVYTGAGISTAASIPDYRGPNGIWTRLQKGKDIGHHDLTTAEPTFTHMALAHLHNKGVVRHVVSQNCDGLHLRSGLPKTSISEVHGNMYIEVCKHCVPAREYVRTIDVTEKTSTFKHTTGRRCYRCGEPLVDTIVHFGERGKLRWPLNWQGACQAAKACDTILCLGSSLKVLRKYTWLWQTHRPLKRRPNLYIVNLQWTPKDKDATLKINGKCDDVMKLVMNKLGLEVPHYKKVDDPIFQISTPLHIDEISTITRPPIEPPNYSPDQMVPLSEDIDKMNSLLNNYRSVFDNLPLGLSANDLMSTLSKLEDIKDKKDKFDSEIYEKVKLEVPSDEEVKEDIKGLKVEFNIDKTIKVEEVKVELDKEVKTEIKEETKDDLEKSLAINNKELMPNFLLEKLSNTYKNATKIDLYEGVKLEAYDGEEEIFSDRIKIDPSANFENKFTKNEVDETLQASELIKEEEEQERLKEGEEKLIQEASTESSFPHEHNLNNSSIFMNVNFSNVSPQSVLQDLANRKSTDFYGTGLCIRSTSRPLGDDGEEEEEEEEDDIASLSSVPSENFSDNQLEDKNCENTADFLLVSENVSRLNDSDSLPEKNKCSASSTIRGSQEVITYQIANSDKENHCIRGFDGDHFSSFSSEVSYDECSIEFPFKKDEDCMPLSFESDGVPLHVLFSEDDNCKQDSGSFILHTKVIDGIIHGADVKVINSKETLLREEPKNELLNANENNSIVTKDNSDPELKALWYKKFCDNLPAEQNIKKKKLSFELDDDVKSLWFWGFDNHQKKEKHPQKRLTRSSYQKALSNLDAESVGLICNCLFSNPQLCRLAMLRSEHLHHQQQQILEEEMIRARESIRKRRHVNYKKYEPVFQVSLKSFTYERRKIRRSRKEEVDENDDEKTPVGEESEREGDTPRKNEEIKVTPGWYGKGYRKLLKKKKNYL